MDVKLVMFKANGQKKEFNVTNETTIIGRGEECDLRIPLAGVSRQHCELAKGEELVIKDKASSNGTYVNNRRVNEVALKAGDRVVVGPIVFTVQIDGKPESIENLKTKAQRVTETDKDEADEADVTFQPDGEMEEEEVEDAASYEDLDPIAALEAMAAESKKKEKEKEEKEKK